MALNTSAAPHLRTKDSTRKVMIDVLIALMPAVIVSSVVYGLKALIVMLSCMVGAELFELFIMKVLRNKKNFRPDFSAAVTGLLLGMNVSIAVQWWQILIGVIFAIGVGKHVFGGLGQNMFNPALVGRVFMIISFPTAMTTWLKPGVTDLVTTATPLAIAKESYGTAVNFSQLMANNNINYMDLFLGKISGSMGEISAVALLIGFIYLVVRGRIKINIPVFYVGTVVIFSSIMYFINNSYGTPLFHVLTGGLIIGALFMATDMVTSPMTFKGQMIYGIGLGVITMVIRYIGSYPEGVSFAILIMNAFVPLIDIWAKPKIYGTVKKEAKI